jgi:hypothetical protein
MLTIVWGTSFQPVIVSVFPYVKALDPARHPIVSFRVALFSPTVRMEHDLLNLLI